MKKAKFSGIKNFSFMKFLIVLPLLLFVMFYSNPVNAQETGAYSPAELRQVMTNVLAGIEKATGSEPKASKAISEISNEAVETIFNSMGDKEKFISAAQQILNRIDSAGAGPTVAAAGVSKAPLRIQGSSNTTPFPPNYPPEGSVPFAYLSLLGLVQAVDDRCDGEGLEIYKAVLAGAETAMVYADGACKIANAICTATACVPAACLIPCIPGEALCIATEAANMAVITAKIPIKLCDAQEAAVNSAEIEAGYENGVTTLGALGSQGDTIDNLVNALAAHDANIDGDLAAHDNRIKNQLSTHDTDIKGLLSTILANQAEIIKLLKTPEGRRPGWNKVGY
jgi:hypothetical protein